MSNISLKSYGKRTDKAMKTILRLERTKQKIFSQTEKYLNDNNLTFNQFKILEVLFHRGDLNIGSITKLTMSTPGNITVVVRNLKRDGFITAIKDPNDKRASILTLTKKGEEKIEEVFPKQAKNLHENMDVLNDDELDTLYELLNKVYKAN